MIEAKTGDRYKVVTPTFPHIVGQGDPPLGYTQKTDSETLFLAWGQSVEADSGLITMSEEISGTMYVRCDILDELARQDMVKCTKRAPQINEPIQD